MEASPKIIPTPTSLGEAGSLRPRCQAHDQEYTLMVNASLMRSLSSMMNDEHTVPGLRWQRRAFVLVQLQIESGHLLSPGGRTRCPRRQDRLLPGQICGLES